MGNEESGQSGDFGQLGASSTSSGMMSSSFNQRTNQSVNIGPISSSLPTGMRNINPMSSLGNRPQGPTSMSRGPGPPPNADMPDVDLSGLTEEEKMMIQSVMARAQEETVGASPGLGPAQPIMNKPNTSSAPTIGYPEQRRMQMPSKEICPLCRQEISDTNLGPKCLDCSRLVCLKCGHHLPAGPDGKSQIWVCNECAKRRPPPVIPPTQTVRHYNDNYYNSAGTPPSNSYQQTQSGQNLNTSQNYSYQMQNQSQPQYQQQPPPQQQQQTQQLPHLQQRSLSQSNINPQLRALPRTSSLEQQSNYDQKYDQSMQQQTQQQPYHQQQQQIQQQYQQQQPQLQQFDSPTRQRNIIKGPSHPPPNQSGLSQNQQNLQNYDQDRDLAFESQQQIKQNQLYSQQQQVQQQQQSDQWSSPQSTREYPSNAASKSYTSSQMLFDNNDKRLVDNNENAMNAVDNNNDDMMIISDQFNNIGGNISGQKSTTSMANSSQDNNELLFSYVSKKSVKNQSINDRIDENHDDDYDDETRFQSQSDHRSQGQSDHRFQDHDDREYAEDFDIDEEYEREGEYDDESEEEDGDIMSSAGTTTVFGLSEFDRSLGEVYTIPEEEEELVSPQYNGRKKNGSQQFKLAIDNDLNSDTAATLQRWRVVSDHSGVGTQNQNQWNQSQQHVQQQQPSQQQAVPTSGTGRKMPQMPQLNQNQTQSSQQQQIQKQQYSSPEYRADNRLYSQDSGQQIQGHQQNQQQFQQQAQKTQYNQDMRQDVRQDVRQDMRQDIRQDMRQDLRQDTRQDANVRQDQRQYSQENNRQDLRQFPQNQRQDNIQSQQMQSQQEFRPDMRQYQQQDNRSLQQESRQLIQSDQNQQNLQHYQQQHQQQQQQQQQQPKQQQIYNQDDYQRFQTSNTMRPASSQPSDTYQTYPSVTTTSTSQAMNTGSRDMKTQEMGSPSHKSLPSMAPIPRTVPLHMVTQQLATSTSSSPPSSSTSSPKHKSVQGQQFAQQLQPKKIPPQIQECWSPPTDLSPILDVSPSIEAAEQEIMEKIKTSGDSMPSMATNIPRATSGTITGMIADFNKAMEALGTTSPTEEQYQIASKLKQLQKGVQNQNQKQQQIQNTTQLTQTQTTKQSLIQDPKNHVSSSQNMNSRPEMVSTSGQQPIIVMTSGPNQSTIPLQLQLNPQAVVPASALLPSPQVEQQLQQQQILIQQQQQFLQIQIEQQKLQKQMTEQLTIRQQQEMDKQKQKEIIAQQLPKQEVIKQDKQVSTSTPPSVTSTPTSAISKAMTSSTTTSAKNSEASVSGGVARKSLHRRLPHPTTEEMQNAVQTLAAQNVSRSPAIAVPTMPSQRPISPLMPRKSQTSVITSQAIIGPLIASTRRTILSTSTIPTTATSTLVSSVIIPTSSTSIHDRISPSPFSYTSALRSHTPITPGGDYSDSQSDVSGDKGKRRKLPSVPFDEEPVSPILATRKLIKDRLAGRAVVSSTSVASKRIPPLRSSSSLDSAVTGLTSQRRPQSPFSSTSDITQFLASTYGQSVLKSPIANIRSPARSPIPPGEPQVGRQLQTSLSSSSLTSPTRFPSYMKNIKQQLWEELKTATEEKQRLLNLRDRDKDFYRRSETDLQTLYDIYSSPVRRRRGRYRRNASDSKIYRHSPSREEIPFKSYEFESLHPTRTGMEVNYRQQRPMSSMATYSDADLGLRESVIPNYMDANDNELYLAANALTQRVRRRSEGSTELMSRLGYGLDPYGRSSTKYYYDDLTQQRRRLGGRPSRSWHPSPYVSEDEDDQMTREEKAAKVRAEIKRRRQQMVDSGRIYRHSIDGSGLYHGSDDLYGQSALTDDEYYSYPPAERQIPRDYYYGRLRPNYSQPSLHGHDNYSYHPSYANQNYDQRMANIPAYPPGTNPRDAALLRRPNFAHPDIGSIMSTDTDTPSELMDPMLNTPAMPILPDMPTRSRKLLEDLGSSSIVAGGHRSGYGHIDHNVIRGSPKKTQFAPNTTKYPKYPFPVKRILLTQDPKIRSVSGNGLGLKVVGGKEIPGSNMIGAYIQKIHPSLTMMGEIKEGMQVIEWNGIPLTGISHDEVSRIITNQVGDEIEVVIRTDINMIQNQYQSYDQPPAYPQVILQHNHPVDETHQQTLHPQHSHQQQYHHQQSHNAQIAISDSQQAIEPIDQQSFDANINDDHNKFDIDDEQLGKVQGEIQLQICYDMKAAILYVTIIEAQNLMTLNSGQFPDPFVKCYLLPPRIVDNQRRTRYFSRCLNPQWKQTMVYPNIKLDDFKRKYLELSVWSFSIYTPHIFLGQVAIDLTDAFILDEESHWYRLGGPNNEVKLKSSSNTNTSSDKINQRREDANSEKWQFETELFSSGRPPIIATSTRSKLTMFGINRHLDRRRSVSSTESSRITNMSQLSSSGGRRNRVIPIVPQTSLSAHPLLQQGCHGHICNLF